MRHILVVFAALLGLVALALLTIPFWLGAAAGALAPRWGATFGEYTRMGYERFALNDVRYRSGAVEATAQRVEVDSPLLWLWHRYAGDGGAIVVERWQVEMKPTGEKPPATEDSTGPAGWVATREQLRHAVAQADAWVSNIAIGPGVVRWAGGEATVGAIAGSPRELALRQLEFGGRIIEAAMSVPAGADELRISASTTTDEASVALLSRGADLSGELAWWGQPAQLSARFEREGWIPAQAVVSADGWNLPAGRVKLGDHYSAVNGRARVEWSAGNFTADITAGSTPLAEPKAPALDVALRARGDLQAVTLEQFRATMPGAQALLTAPVTIARSGEFRDTPARISTEIDLAQLPWITATGTVTGEAEVVSGLSVSPAVDFHYVARDVASQGVALSSAEARGRLAWPRVQLSSATVVGRDGERLEMRGGWDFAAKAAEDVRVEGELRRATFARWLPENIQFTTIAVNATASGPLAEIAHTGSVKADGIVAAGLKPLNLSADWQGSGTKADRIAARVVAGESHVSLEGSADAESVRLTAMRIAPHGAEPVALTSVATLRWKPALQIESFHLAGGTSRIDADLTWGETGRISLGLREVPSAWLADFIELPGPAWNVGAVAITGSWDRGPMTFEAIAHGSAQLADQRVAAVNVHFTGERDGVRIVALRALESGNAAINATGRLPVVITPGGPEVIRIDERGAISLQAVTTENEALWQQLSSLIGFNLVSPRISADIAGTWQHPRGQLRASVARLTAGPRRPGRALPRIEQIEIALNGDRESVVLERFGVQLEGQPVRASGRLPLPAEGWTAVREDPLAFIRRGAGLTLEVPATELAALRDMLPEIVVPQGTVEVRVTLREGRLDGGLRLTNAATRPAGALGALHDINADVQLAGETVELRSITASLGGEEVRISGTVTLPPLDTLGGGKPAALPRFDVAVKAGNLPLVRQMGLLVRADLDVALTSPENETPQVRGTVRLRDSLFLQDVRALVPAGTQSKSSRPPYFAVEAEPFNDWRLDVKVVGDQFMRLRTTLFNGTASADFQVGGTLGEPTMLGEATIDRGNVRLPFATFEVQEGRVSLTAAQPHDPQLWVTATTRRYEYDLRMEVSGSASSPTLKFESTPPLEHGRVVLMVMAGVVPNDTVTVTQQQRATRIGTYLGQSLLSGFGDGGDASRLTITSGADISEQGRETYEFDYKLSDRWSLAGEYDEYDTHSFGAKWRAYSRGGSRDGRVRGALAGSSAGADPDEADSAKGGEPRKSDKPAKIDVDGLGWFSNLEMEASLKRVLGGKRGATMNAQAVEDAMFLLLSAVQEKGYLRPVVHVETTGADGQQRSFTNDSELATPVPRDVAARFVTFRVERGTRYLVDDVRLSGLRAFDEDTARSYFAGEPGLFKRKSAHIHTPDRLKRGVASLEAALRERGYAEADVRAAEPQIDHDTGAVALAIEVSEGPQWRVAGIVSGGGGVAGVADVDVSRFAGQPWSEAVAQDIAAEIRRAYLQSGYPDARVRMEHATQPAGDGGKAVNLTAHIRPGPLVTIGEVRFEGNVKTKESVLRRRVAAGPGDPLNPVELQHARHRIARLGVFEDVKLDFEPAEGPVRDAVFRLQPGRQLEVKLLAGYNTYEQLRAGVEARQFNLWGRAHQARGLLVQSMKSTRGEYSYTVPELFGENVTGTARLFGLQREEVAFLRQEYGARFSVDTPLRFLGANASAGYNYEVLRNRDNELETRDFDNRQVEVASLETGLTRDRRDNPLMPRDGYRWFSRIEAASPAFGGRAEYQRTEFGATYHRALDTGRWLHFAAAHGVVTTFGTTDDRLPVNRRFFPGGDGSIRGYNVGEAAPRAADGRFTGAKSYVSASVEFEQALAAQWSAVVFTDALGTAGRLSSYPFNEILASVGAGIRYQTLIGPVRAEYGYNLNRRAHDPRGTLLISIGFPF